MSSQTQPSTGWGSKRKLIYGIFIGIFLILFSAVTFEPFVKIFDRADVWVGVFPLSQFIIIFCSWAMAAFLCILYLIEKHYLTKK